MFNILLFGSTSDFAFNTFYFVQRFITQRYNESQCPVTSRVQGGLGDGGKLLCDKSLNEIKAGTN